MVRVRWGIKVGLGVRVFVAHDSRVAQEHQPCSSGVMELAPMRCSGDVQRLSQHIGGVIRQPAGMSQSITWSVVQAVGASHRATGSARKAAGQVADLQRLWSARRGLHREIDGRAEFVTVNVVVKGLLGVGVSCGCPVHHLSLGAALMITALRRATGRVTPPRCAAAFTRRLSTHTESDAFGSIEVPSYALWGAQTQRSIQNFPIGGVAARMPMPVVYAQALLQKCAAKYNVDTLKMPEDVGNAIAAAADEIIAGKLDDHFPLVIFPMRGSTNLTNSPP